MTRINILLFCSLLSVSSSVFSQLDKSKHKPCGIDSSGYGIRAIEDRIYNCSMINSNSLNFDLVEVTDQGHEVYRDPRTFLLWGDIIEEKATFYEAKDLCAKKMKKISGISVGEWRVPTFIEVKAADNRGNGLNTLPNMNKTFIWTSTIYDDEDTRLNTIYGVKESYPKDEFEYIGSRISGAIKRNKAASVRCVNSSYY